MALSTSILRDLSFLVANLSRSWTRFEPTYTEICSLSAFTIKPPFLLTQEGVFDRGGIAKQGGKPYSRSSPRGAGAPLCYGVREVVSSLSK